MIEDSSEVIIVVDTWIIHHHNFVLATRRSWLLLIFPETSPDEKHIKHSDSFQALQRHMQLYAPTTWGSLAFFGTFISHITSVHRFAHRHLAKVAAGTRQFLNSIISCPHSQIWSSMAVATRRAKKTSHNCAVPEAPYKCKLHLESSCCKVALQMTCWLGPSTLRSFATLLEE